MRITPTNTNYNIRRNEISHKATFPVVYWVAETNGSYVPIWTKKNVEEFQKKIIKFLTASYEETRKKIQKKENKLKNPKLKDQERKKIRLELMDLYEIIGSAAQNFKQYLASPDADFRINPIARSFYDITHGYVNEPNSTAFIITGHNVNEFDNTYAKPLGIQRALRKKRLDKGATVAEAETQEYKEALKSFRNGGYSYVNEHQNRIKDINGNTYALHVKLEKERDTNGEVLRHKFIDARFKREKGPLSPLVRLGYCKE